ncbi:MAG: hypothetical protein LBJ24_01425 [Treponema sp.]|jgi:hypothetical protein|nr:hypothetical protein [Treponema sp.]
MKNRKWFWICLLFLVFLPLLRAQTEDTEGFTDSTDLEAQISSRPELKLRLIETMTFPFLRGEGPLTEGNNIKTIFTAEVSPVSVGGIGEAVWTPVAFFQAAAGTKAGSGWNIDLFGTEVYGLGVNAPSSSTPRKTEVKENAFDGLVWSAWGGGALQFDLAAIIPGDWTHVLFRTYHEARYSTYTKAADGESWFFEGDYGENRNGWIYYSTYLLGYQMPLSPVLDTVAFMAELKKNLYNTPGGDYWGDNLGDWILSGFFNFTLGPRIRTTLAVQLRSWRNHGSSDLENAGMLYYQDRELYGDYGERRLAFYRAALILTYKLR